MRSSKKLVTFTLLLTCGFSLLATTPRSQYDAFKAQAKKSYNDFRKQANKRYAEFISQPWDSCEIDTSVVIPNYDYIVPEVRIEDGDDVILVSMDSITPEDETAGLQEVFKSGFDKLKKGASKFAKRVKKSFGANEEVNPKRVDLSPLPAQPQPIAPVEVPPTLVSENVPFEFFGTKCEVSFPVHHDFELKNTSNREVSNAWKRLSEDDFASTLRDCLALRDSLTLNDWAYLKMLESLGQTVYGDTNKGRLFTAYLFCQSGYSMRLARTVDMARLGMMYVPNDIVYSPYYEYDNKTLVPFSCGDDNRLQFVNHAFDKESNLHLQTDVTPKFSIDASAPRHIASLQYPDIEFDVSVNKNLIDFYDTYPDGQKSDNMLTRYAYRANIPLDPSIKESLYPQLKQKLLGMSKIQAANALLDWLQTGFTYEFDNVVWGADRVFFAEETLFYPYCDCEDRSILYSKLVRDILGLDVALVYYPGHLATAVCFDDEDMNGVYFYSGDKKYFICDPTIIVAHAGTQMSNIDASKMQYIEL